MNITMLFRVVRPCEPVDRLRVSGLGTRLRIDTIPISESSLVSGNTTTQYVRLAWYPGMPLHNIWEWPGIRECHYTKSESGLVSGNATTQYLRVAWCSGMPLHNIWEWLGVREWHYTISESGLVFGNATTQYLRVAWCQGMPLQNVWEWLLRDTIA
jgi:hypothetical protein